MNLKQIKEKFNNEFLNNIKERLNNVYILSFNQYLYYEEKFIKEVEYLLNINDIRVIADPDDGFTTTETNKFICLNWDELNFKKINPENLPHSWVEYNKEDWAIEWDLSSKGDDMVYLFNYMVTEFEKVLKDIIINEE